MLQRSDDILKLRSDDLEIQYEILPMYPNDKRRAEIRNEIDSIDEKLSAMQQRVDELNVDIDRLTNHADGLDYTVAVASGIISGIVDSVWVGEFSFDRANDWGNDKVNNFVISVAQKQGYLGKDLPGAIEHLEKNFPIIADKATNDYGGGLQHHLRDFSHHPTIVGLFFSLLTQFTKKVYGTDVLGVFKVVPVSGILLGNNLYEKITFGVVNWFFHMVSDMAGSHTSAVAGKTGTGLPGPIVSLLKEVSALPIFTNVNKKGYNEFSVWISKLFNGTLLGKRDENGTLIEAVKFDLRTEIGVINEFKRQSFPVIINECIVRGFYFIRRLFNEIKVNNICDIADLKNINWKNTLPFNNRTITRMLTISTGTFMATDMIDAAIRGAVKSGGNGAVFAKNFILRVNFVGVGRFAVAVGTDIGMGIKRTRKESERRALYSEMISLTNAKMFYSEADMWISVKEAGQATEEAYIATEKFAKAFVDYFEEVTEASNSITECDATSFREKNSELTSELLDILDF